METRIQFRIDEETKNLAQKAAKMRGKTLSEACRDFAEQLANEATPLTPQEKWLKMQVESAMEKVESGNAHFTSNNEVKKIMSQRKDELRKKFASQSKN